MTINLTYFIKGREPLKNNTHTHEHLLPGPYVLSVYAGKVKTKLIVQN